MGPILQAQWKDVAVGPLEAILATTDKDINEEKPEVTHAPLDKIWVPYPGN